MLYIIDTDTISFGPYQFAQNPDCGYTMTETRENLPLEPFLVFYQDSKMFTIERTTNEDFIGIYDILIRTQFDQLN